MIYLHTELNAARFVISRSAMYLRLLPKRANSIEGKHHVITVPVKLKRPESNLHSKHPDGRFCKASIFALEELASCLGTSYVSSWVRMTNAVSIDLTACNKQSPLLMNLDYQVRLPDHDWVVAERHKLIPSVCAAVESLSIFSWTVRSRRKRWVPLSSLRVTCTVRLSHSLLNDVIQCVAYTMPRWRVLWITQGAS